MDNQNLSDRDIDILITLGAAEYVKQIETNCLDDDVEVSPRFRQTMDNIINKHKRREKYQAKRKTAGLIAACISIVFGLGLVSSVSVNAFGMKDFFIRVYDKYFTLGHAGANQNSPDINAPIKMVYSDLYLPAWLPDSFEYQGFYEGDDFYVIQYKFNQDTLRLTQIGIDSTMNVDNEVIDYQEIKESGKSYYVLQKDRGDKRNVRIVWMQGQHQLVIESSLDQDVMLKIAKNVEFYRK